MSEETFQLLFELFEGDVAIVSKMWQIISRTRTGNSETPCAVHDLKRRLVTWLPKPAGAVCVGGVYDVSTWLVMYDSKSFAVASPHVWNNLPSHGWTSSSDKSNGK